MLAARSVRKLFSAGELLLSEGKPCNGMHINRARQGSPLQDLRERPGADVLSERRRESVAEILVFDGGP